MKPLTTEALRHRDQGEIGGSEKPRKFLVKAILWVYNIPVRILHVDEQAVSGVPELHWRQK